MTAPLNYFLVEASGKWGDYKYTVVADNEAEAKVVVEDYRDGSSEALSFDKFYGPFLISKGIVLHVEEPE